MLNKALSLNGTKSNPTAILSWQSYQDDTRRIQVLNYETSELYGQGTSGSCKVPVGVKLRIKANGYLAFLNSYWQNIEYTGQEGMYAFSIIVPKAGSAFFYYIPVRIA